MKKTVLLFFILISFSSFGQQAITSKLNASIKNGGTGVAYFTIQYASGSYQTNESVVITTNATDTNNITYNLRGSIKDTGKNRIDTSFALISTQVSMLNSFYQSASNKSNPDPAVSNIHTGAKGNLTVNLCCGTATDMTYNTTTHISLIRYLLSYWTNWN